MTISTRQQDTAMLAKTISEMLQVQMFMMAKLIQAGIISPEEADELGGQLLGDDE